MPPMQGCIWAVGVSIRQNNSDYFVLNMYALKPKLVTFYLIQIHI